MSLGFNENEALILSDFIINPIVTEDCFVDNDIFFDLSNYNVCELYVTLKNASLNFELTEECCVFSFYNCNLSKNENQYVLTGISDFNDLMNKENLVQIMTFESVEIEAKSLKAEIDIRYNDNPWDVLIDFAYDIREKINRPYLTVNEKELALRSLLNELCNIRFFNEEADAVQFNILKSYLPIDNKLNLLLEKVENSQSIEKHNKASKQLLSYMCSEQFEFAWKDICGLLETSQFDYEDVSNPEIYDKLKEERDYIDTIMHQYGYDGCYPSYNKEDRIKGFHILRNDNKIKLVCNQPASIFIECKDYLGKYGSITLERTTFRGECYKAKNKLSSIFTKKGISFNEFELINYHIDKEGNVIFDEGAEYIPSVICKEAEMKKLSKAEKNVVRPPISKKEFVLTILLGMIIGLGVGLFAAVVMFLVFTLLEFLVVLLFFDSVSDFPQLFMETPWLKLFLIDILGCEILIPLSLFLSDLKGRT